jgi:protein-disulfide isomerase
MPNLTPLFLCKRARLIQIACCILLCMGVARAQSPDDAALKPPAGAHVAIIEWADLQCPACAHADPLLKAAAAKYGIPWVRHDFIIPYHTWSQSAAVKARWFDTKSKALGNEYRDQVFANQPYIYNLMLLNQFTDKFAETHGIQLPFALDPEGKLLAAVQADTELGRRIGVNATPAIYIVTSGGKKGPFFHVTDPDKDLDNDILQAIGAMRAMHK